VPRARQLGAHHYIDNAAKDAATALQKLGGAKAILATATSAEAMSSVKGGFAVNGTLFVIGVVDALNVRAAAPSGKAIDQGLVFWHLYRLARHFGIQPADRSAVNERDIPARTRGRRISAHDRWAGAVSRRPDDRPLTADPDR